MVTGVESTKVAQSIHLKHRACGSYSQHAVATSSAGSLYYWLSFADVEHLWTKVVHFNQYLNACRMPNIGLRIGFWFDDKAGALGKV